MKKTHLVVFGVVGVTLFAGGTGFQRWLRARGLTTGDFVEDLRRGDEPRFSWRSIDKKHWQAEPLAGATSPAPTRESLAATDAREATNAGCPPGMVRVKGAFRRDVAESSVSTGAIERLQDAACTDWISRDFPARCRAFDSARIAEEVAKLGTEPLDFCIDRFEYPNALGQNPMIVATFHEAERVCKEHDKRLCTENEWTFACEGEEARPYPYGFTRDEAACVIDRSWRPFTEGALQPRDGDKARAELDRLWQGEPSGSRPLCRSPFGVYDMTGNVDEWTRSVNPTGYRSILKGGYWGPVRARCRPSTRAHNEDFVAYQQSFRCCSGTVASELDGGAPVADAGTSPAVVPATPAGLEAEHADPEDELESIQRSRAIHCAAGKPGAGGGTWPGVFLVAGLVLAAVRRRGRRNRDPARRIEAAGNRSDDLRRCSRTPRPGA